ncbi:MAG: hypothetical protein QW279_09750 [Candidatus Jordarchaeaceae archaeon]
MKEYTIVDFLKALSDDDLEKELLQLIAEGLADEALLVKLLEKMEKKDVNL